jgi:hypothetical protein
VLTPEDDHRGVLDPPVDTGDISCKHEVEPSMCTDELEPVARQVLLEEAPRCGLRIGEQE